LDINRATLRAVCQHVAGKTVLTSRYHETPLKITKTFREPDTNALLMYVMDVSPGLMEGDHYELQLKQQLGTHLVMTNQSFTKVHPALLHGSSTTARFELEEGAKLEYMPEPTIPYKDSMFTGRNEFHLAKDASLIFAEIITPGRTHRDERYQFATFATTTELYLDGQLVASDRYLLKPGSDAYSAIGVMEQYTHQAVMWIFSPKVNADLLVLLRAELELLARERVLAAASLAEKGGIVVRAVGHSVWELQQLCQRLWDISREKLWGYPPCLLRK